MLMRKIAITIWFSLLNIEISTIQEILMKNENLNTQNQSKQQDPSINVNKNSSLDKQHQQQQPSNRQQGSYEQDNKLQQGQNGKKTQPH